MIYISKPITSLTRRGVHRHACEFDLEAIDLELIQLLTALIKSAISGYKNYAETPSPVGNNIFGLSELLFFAFLRLVPEKLKNIPETQPVFIDRIIIASCSLSTKNTGPLSIKILFPHFKFHTEPADQTHFGCHALITTIITK